MDGPCQRSRNQLGLFKGWDELPFTVLGEEMNAIG